MALPRGAMGLSQFVIVRNMFPLSEPHILYARFRVVPTVSVVWFAHRLVRKPICDIVFCVSMF